MMATLHVHVVPNAKIDSLVGQLATASPSRGGHGGAIKIKLRAPAVEGKANAALIRFLAQRLKISTRQIILIRGQKSREKIVRIDSFTDEQLRNLLL
jgi:uncharacterized protein